MWKRELQGLADESGLTMSVCHLPPGTGKWDKIEHRMFCHISNATNCVCNAEGMLRMRSSPVS
ncbi:MAG: hypothetical protein HGA63_10200 [Syntrophobacteraceae bacterium]|nr:hypothetical protein [Syntrophobacteraceae bacterium]